MNRLIIICTNNANTGKTTALWYVYRLLKQKHKVVYAEYPPIDDVPTDVRAVFDVGGKRVGIETMGDNVNAIEHRKSIWGLAQDLNCDVVITASRMRSETRSNVEDFINDFGYDAVWMSHDFTHIERLRNTLNLRYAKRVVQYVEEWLVGACC